MVENPYRAAIKREWDGSRDDLEDMTADLRGAGEMLTVAWTGGVSRDRVQLLDWLRDQMSQAANAAGTVFFEAFWRQPELVDEGAWQTRWRHQVW